MIDLVTVTRTWNAGYTTRHTLTSHGDRLRLVGPTGHGPELPAMTPLEAMRHYATLCEAPADAVTRYLRHEPDLIPFEGLLDAIRPVGRLCESVACYGTCRAMTSTSETAQLVVASDWALGYRITVDNHVVYTAALEDAGLAVVHADDPQIPFDSWQELLGQTKVDHVGWREADEPDSFGTYLIRPGLIATAVRTTLGGRRRVEVRLGRTPDSDPFTIMTKRNRSWDESCWDSALKATRSTSDDPAANVGHYRTVLDRDDVVELGVQSYEMARAL